MRIQVSLLLALLLSCGDKTPQVVSPPAKAGLSPELRAKLSYVSLLTRARVVDDNEWSSWKKRGLSPAEVVSELTEDPFVSRKVAPTLIFRLYAVRDPAAMERAAYALRSKEVEGTMLYFRGRKPCSLSEAVSVAPWWDIAKPVKVCARDYKPAVWATEAKSGGEKLSCGPANVFWDGKPFGCGCGENLMRCTPLQTRPEVFQAALDELRGTTHHVVSNDLPLKTLFVSESTWRSPLIEKQYLVNQAESQRVDKPAALLASAEGWPKAGKFAPRNEVEPGQHSGLLTSYALLYHTFDPRQRMRIVYETMWCATPSAPGALPSQVLALNGPTLSMANDGWQALAKKPICTNCHARLDYGRRFFGGSLDTVLGEHVFQPGQTKGQGELYGNNIGDLRGKAELNPRAFGELATKQPEFSRCMSKNIVDYVFGPSSTEERIQKLAKSAPSDELRFRPMLRKALLDFLACTDCDVLGPVPRANPVRRAPRKLTELVEENCTACHSEGGQAPSLEGALSEGLVVRALDQVASKHMPPKTPLSDDLRLEFIDAAHAELGGGSTEERERAKDFLAAQTEPPPSLPFAVTAEFSSRAKGKDGLNLMEVAVEGRFNIFTPQYATFTLLQAAQACAQAKNKDACIDAALTDLWGSAPQTSAH